MITLCALLLVAFQADESIQVDVKQKAITFKGIIKPSQFNHLLGLSNHHFIVSKHGRSAKHALVVANPRDIHIQRALEQLGARAGNNLSPEAWQKRGDQSNSAPDQAVQGSLVAIEILWEDKARTANGLFLDLGGKGFEFRLGGHEAYIPEWLSGCVACLQSCPGGRMSNARYTMRELGSLSRFKLADGLPKEGTEVRIRIRLLGQAKS